MGFELWPHEEFFPTNDDFDVLSFDEGSFDTLPSGYLASDGRAGVALMFIPFTQTADGYPRVLFVNDLEDSKRKVLSAGGEVYLSVCLSPFCKD